MLFLKFRVKECQPHVVEVKGDTGERMLPDIVPQASIVLQIINDEHGTGMQMLQGIGAGVFEQQTIDFAMRNVGVDERMATALMKVVPLYGRQVRSSNGTRLKVVDESEKQTHSGTRPQPEPAHQTRQKAVEHLIGIVSTGVVKNLRHQLIGERRMYAIAMTTTNAQKPNYRVANQHFPYSIYNKLTKKSFLYYVNA